MSRRMSDEIDAVLGLIFTSLGTLAELEDKLPEGATRDTVDMAKVKLKQVYYALLHEQAVIKREEENGGGEIQ